MVRLGAGSSDVDGAGGHDDEVDADDDEGYHEGEIVLVPAAFGSVKSDVP